ncbi:helix-turn-helix domain-containing protein [Nocardia sp. NPDC058176]|uniref:helix-turn-helix domain-containing protein n=1 Tax=Nocardia sp. NPDC058176 TaxID=3346368 RepID=UPI0036DA48A0
MGESESLARWESFLSESYVPLVVDPDRGRPCHGEIQRERLPGFDLSTISVSSQRIRRTRSGIARTDGEFWVASVLTEGFGVLRQDDRIAAVRPGEMVFYDTTRPYQWDIDDSCTQVIVMAPLDAVREQLGGENTTLPTAVTVAADSAGGVVAGFFRDLARVTQAAPTRASVLADSGVALFASAVKLAAGELPVGQPAQTLTREQVLTFMRARCTDPALTVDEIARACLVSRRSLYRLFDEVGEGLSTVLRRMRVERAQSMLVGDPTRSTASIGVAAGFSSERHFFRAFRVETGMTPGEYRQGAAPAGEFRRFSA